MSEQKESMLEGHRRLLAVVQEEQEAVRTGNLTLLENLADFKVALLAEIAGAGKEASLGPEAKEELRSLLQQILSINELNAASVEQLRDQAADEMAELYTERKAERAYLGAGIPRR